MKRILLPTLATFAAILPLTAANAQSLFGINLSQHNYVEGNLGAAFDGNTHIRTTGLAGAKADAGNSSGFFASGLVGHELGGGFAVEGEALYAGTGIKDSQTGGLVPAGTGKSVDTYGGLVNLKYQIPWTFGRFSPYAGAGVGYGGVSYNLGDYNSRDNGLLWQAKAGVDVRLSPRLSLDLGYRYLNGPQYEPDGTTLPGFQNVNLSSHQHIASAGLKYRF